jgi:predicted metal-dependent hydrolase
MTGSRYPAQELRTKAYAWALKLRVNPRVIRVQAMRHKWGSCTSSGTVTFATDLADESARMQDFVIVHELLHLRYPNHGRLFKTMLTTHVPTWKRLERGGGQARS